MATKWGSIVGDYGRVGIKADVSSTATTTTVTITTYFRSRYSIQDSTNKYYYNSDSKTATSLIGSRSLNTSSSTSWSDSNIVKLAGPTTYKYTRGHSSSTKYFAVKLTGVERVGGTMTVWEDAVVPAKTKYTISYNANGGSGAPGSQTKWYGESATLSSSKPTRTGYNFVKWNTSSNGGGTNYSSGATYTANAGVTLYAIWSPVTYTVAYNANGGSGAPSAQTKTYGKSLTLSSSIPTRAGYNFKGWSTSSSGNVVYNKGSIYNSNTSITLYAVWEVAYRKPRISGFKVSRCDEQGNPDESGTFIRVAFDWAADEPVTKLGAEYRRQASSQWSPINTDKLTGNGTKGSVPFTVIDSGYSIEVTYFIRVFVEDGKGRESSNEISISTVAFPIDVKSGGKGIAIGKVAEKDIFDVGMSSRFRKTITLENGANMTTLTSTGNELTMFFANKNNEFGFGYDSRAKSIGTMYFDGNDIRIRSNNSIEIDKELTVSSHGVRATFGAKNTSYCHIYSTQPFAINNDINLIGGARVGTQEYPAGGVNVANNSAAYTANNAAGNGKINLIWATSGNHVQIGGGSNSIPGNVYIKTGRAVQILTEDPVSTTDTGIIFSVRNSGTSGGSTTSKDGIFFATGCDSDGGFIRSYYTYARTTTNSANLYITSAGTFARHASSSKRYKKDIISIDDNLKKHTSQNFMDDRLNIEPIIDPHGLYDIPVMQYKYIDGYLASEDANVGKDVIGIIAEDVAEFYPQAAIYDEKGVPEAWNSEPVLVGLLYLVQEQKKEIDDLKLEINSLKN